MRRWDRLQDAYMEQYRARGLSESSALCTESRLDRWGRWLKKRRPRVVIERIDAETITRYIESCTSFRSKATVYGTLSTMRGDYLVRQGLWNINPLRQVLIASYCFFFLLLVRGFERMIGETSMMRIRKKMIIP